MRPGQHPVSEQAQVRQQCGGALLRAWHRPGEEPAGGGALRPGRRVSWCIFGTVYLTFNSTSIVDFKDP